VRLINGHQLNRNAFQALAEALVGEAFRRDVEQLQPPLRQLFVHLGLFLRIEGGIQPRRRDSLGTESLHLVLHQRDQWRNHQRDPI
jgi:hypothetical protein